MGRLREAVENAPHDPFHRCNLACHLAADGAYDDALMQLTAALTLASSAITAGCVVSAIREVADAFATAWRLPVMVDPWLSDTA